MKKKDLIAIIFSILISGILIALAIYFSNVKNEKIQEKVEILEKKIKNKIEIVDPLKDHIQGNPNADIFIIRYSDLECIGCKMFEKTIQKLEKYYQRNNRIAFVFRHYPLYKNPLGKTILHPTAGVEAKATECVKEITKSEDKFFEMVNKIFETTQSNGHYPVENLPQLAEEIGVNKEEFKKCISSKKAQKIIDEYWEKAYNAKITSTPTVYIQLRATGKSFKAAPGEEIIKKAIDSYLLK